MSGAKCKSWLKGMVGNGTLKAAVKGAVMVFFAGSLWGTLWAKVDNLEQRFQRCERQIDLLVTRGWGVGGG